MENNTGNKGGFSIQIGGNVGGNALIGDFSNNSGTLNSHNRINIHPGADEQLSKEEEFKKLAIEFYELLKNDQSLAQGEKEESLELVELNEQFIASGQPKKTMIKSLLDNLNGLKTKLQVDSPLLTNVASLIQILGFFL